MKTPFDRAHLTRLLDQLQDPPGELIRQDKHWATLGLDAEQYTTPDAIVELLLEHPKAMQRPIVLRGERALIARPSDRLLELWGE